MTIDAILEPLRQGSTAEIPPGWGQGRATFGGLVAALLVTRTQALVPADRVLRSLTVSFVGPVAAGACTLEAAVIRSGKSVTQAECRLVQNGEVLAVMLASFGAARESKIAVAPAAAPVFAGPEEGRALPYVPGLMPEFLGQFDFRWSWGGFPVAGIKEPDFGGWLRFSAATGVVGAAQIAALVDAWPPSVMPMYTQPAPSSSLTWTLEFVDDAPGKSGNDWWQYEVKTEAAANGYVHAQAQLWDDAGRLIAISRQVSTIFI